MINSGRKLEELPAPYNRGFNITGLWRVSRHPNYFAEQSIWVSFYLFSIVAGSGILNWSVCGAVLLILLFMGSSTLGEHISKSKYPEYGEYIRKVNRYFPGKTLLPAWMNPSMDRNRVGGKRSSFSPTFVFRPLTPPYVPFGIRRFFIVQCNLT